MEAQYLFRLDDACPTMDLPKWQRFFDLFDKYQIKPIVAVIPNNEDAANMIAPPLKKFWDKVTEWHAKGYHIALHGYNHVYTTTEPGLVSLNRFSEFAGVEKTKQAEKILKGYKEFTDRGISADIWIAPGHSFDNNTLAALNLYTNIKVISDGFAIWPYRNKGFFWLPQQLWDVKEQRDGVWTVCYHPNITSEDQFARLEAFVAKNVRNCLFSMDEIILKYGNRRRSMHDLVFAYNIYAKYFIKSLLAKR